MDTDRLLAGLGTRVRALRAERSWTLQELARQAEMSPRFLVQVESGEANLSVRKLAASRARSARHRQHSCRGPGRGRPPGVALLGPRGAGKTTIGRKLARRLRVPFVELDQRIEEAGGPDARTRSSRCTARHYNRTAREREAAWNASLGAERPARLVLGHRPAG
jgi:XRE family aerobic/anaerobic benzoate catabolism transcriptional regulator